VENRSLYMASLRLIFSVSVLLNSFSNYKFLLHPRPFGMLQKLP
jgi:hypothetical protein